MTRPTSIAKISTPRLFGIVARERLFACLDENRGRPLIWLDGPPGAGKTTLVASYLEARNIPTLWYQVEPSDADPANLFHYLTLAAEAFPGVEAICATQTGTGASVGSAGFRPDVLPSVVRSIAERSGNRAGQLSRGSSRCAAARSRARRSRERTAGKFNRLRESHRGAAFVRTAYRERRRIRLALGDAATHSG